jgi:hypothetical protein
MLESLVGKIFPYEKESDIQPNRFGLKYGKYKQSLVKDSQALPLLPYMEKAF